MTASDDFAGSGHWIVPPLYPRPEVSDVAECLRRCAPALAEGPIEFLAEGWEFWAFSADDYVLRLPKTETGRAVLAMDRRMLPELARRMKTPVPIVDLYCEDGPNGQPLGGHRRLPGVLLETTGQPRSPEFGRELGTLLRELHTFPVDRALALGVHLHDGVTFRQRRIRFCKIVRERAFPVLAEPLQEYVETSFTRYLDESANFEFEPCLVHQDVDSNILIDPDTGTITGLIDFSAVVVSKPAIDFWLPLEGFAAMGLEAQLPACLEAAGVTEDEIRRMLPEVEFWTVRYPLFAIMHGLLIGDNAYIQDAIQELERLAGLA